MKNKPLFAYNAKAELFVSGLAFGFLFITAVSGVLSDEVDALDIAWIGLIEFVFLYLILSRWSLPFWTVEFFDDGIAAEKLGSKVQMQYSSIKEVQLTKSFWRGLKIAIYLGTQGKPVIVLKNPKNSKLKTDLYSWLLTKKSR